MNPQDLPGGYESKSAAEKAQLIWETVVNANPHAPTQLPELKRAKPWEMASVAASAETLARSLDRTEDLMEPNRPKIIHARGSVAMIELEMLADTPFTGVLAPPAGGGGAIGLVRMSLATPPTGNFAVTPGMGLKLFVDAKPSLDLLAMNHTVGQGQDFNLFSHTFTHDLSDAHTELRLPQRILQVFFKRVTSNPRRLTIDHFGATSSAGETVEEPKIPHRLVFRPHEDVRVLFRGRHGEDFRQTLTTIRPGALLYYVEAVAPGPKRTRGRNQVIGMLRTTSQFVSSDGGDRLFFRHMVNPNERKAPVDDA